MLLQLLSAATPDPSAPVTSLLSNALAVPQPLHISLSAPLVLRAETRAAFQAGMLDALRAALPRGGSIVVRPSGGVAWRANAEGTRWFLVLGLARGEDEVLGRLLGASNAVARRFGCAALYDDLDEERGWGGFHVSVAWTLMAPGRVPDGSDQTVGGRGRILGDEVGVGPDVLQRVRDMRIEFREVKVKLGRDVTSLPFGSAGPGAHSEHDARAGFLR